VPAGPLTTAAAGEGAWADDPAATFDAADPGHAPAGVRPLVSPGLMPPARLTAPAGPCSLGALRLQSGSFFSPLLDSQERSFPHARVAAASASAGTRAAHLTGLRQEAAE
jgi:hypothetical protein